jgi:hypothetical protein
MTKTKTIIIFLVIISIIAGCIGVYFYKNGVHPGKINYTVKDTLPDGGGKKVKVILLGGQSNASGCSFDDYLKINVTPEKYAEYEAGYDNVYINYFASGTNASGEFVKCGARQGEHGTRFGPELGLAEKLHEMYPDETFFIIKWAWGGTSLYDQWISPTSRGKTGELYEHFVAFANTSLNYLKSKNYDVSIEGMCWMQGESDSFSTKHATDYEQSLINFIYDIRKEFSPYADDDGIAFIDAEIADNPVFWVYCDLVNQSKRGVVTTSPLNRLIDTNAEGLICTEEPFDNPDIPHYDSMSEIKLGHLFAESLSEFID